MGVGALSWITLQLEIRGWERFQNRRQIASYTGLCPGIHNSNGRGREGHINRCGQLGGALHPYRDGLAHDSLAA
jgi:transposase